MLTDGSENAELFKAGPERVDTNEELDDVDDDDDDVVEKWDVDGRDVRADDEFVFTCVDKGWAVDDNDDDEGDDAVDEDDGISKIDDADFGSIDFDADSDADNNGTKGKEEDEDGEFLVRVASLNCE